MRLEELEPGDLAFGLVKSNVGMNLAYVTRAPYSHVFVVVDSRQYVEAAPGGVRKVEFSTALADAYVYLDVFRFQSFAGESGKAAAQRFCSALESTVGVHFYGVVRTVCLIVWTCIRILLLRRRIRSPFPSFPVDASRMPKTFSCASLVSWALAVCEEEPRLGLTVMSDSPVWLCSRGSWSKGFWQEMVYNYKRIRNKTGMFPPRVIDLCSESISNIRGHRRYYLLERKSTLELSHRAPARLAGFDCMPSDLLACAELAWRGELDLSPYHGSDDVESASPPSSLKLAALVGACERRLERTPRGG